ncbi:Coenzyme F420 hydrogenase/dehydrogenase, beta subunit C-terminal domain [Myxococcota bacterium]|nr:Coenzyme F420 hydrogenase/dehydrogenase, beta subunit C-terminal domain [Myxococcota bacterium]
MESEKPDEIKARYRSLVKEGEDPGDWAYAWRASINRGGFRAVDFLMEEIVDAGKCVGCAACVTICPTDVFDYVDEQPVDTRENACVRCVLCADVCPSLRPPDPDAEAVIGLREPVKNDGYGPYNYEFLARSIKPQMVKDTQDGGFTSELLIHLLDAGEIKGAVLGDTYDDNPQLGFQRLVRNSDDVMDCAGSRYTYSPNTVALKEAMENDIKPIAVVGVPCQVNGVRQQQHSSIRLAVTKWYRENISLTIGLFCSEAFTNESVTSIAEDYNVPLTDIENINIKGKVIVRLKGGKEEILSLSDYQRYARPACLYCRDYAVDHADIGVGGIGLMDWTYVVVRTKAGHEATQKLLKTGIMETMEVPEKAKKLLARLSARKANKPLPAQLPTLQERLESGDLDPKNFQGGKNGKGK